MDILDKARLGVPGRWHDTPGLDIASPETHASSRANRPRLIPDEPRWLATDLDPEEVPLYGDKKKAAEWERLVERAKNRGVDLDQKKHLWYNSRWWDMYDDIAAEEVGTRGREIYWGVNAAKPTGREILASPALRYWASLKFPPVILEKSLRNLLEKHRSLKKRLRRLAAQGSLADRIGWPE